jgi:hypothetical protein
MAIAAIVGLILVAFPAHAQQSRLVWTIETSKAAHVDKAKAERIYLRSCQILEDRLEWTGPAIRPRIRVHVGVACPMAGFSGACMNPLMGVLYVPDWDDDAVYALIQITVIGGLQQAMEHGERESLTMRSPLRLAL